MVFKLSIARGKRDRMSAVQVHHVTAFDAFATTGVHLLVFRPVLATIFDNVCQKIDRLVERQVNMGREKAGRVTVCPVRI